MDNPDDHYDWDEFSMEVVYDWLHYQPEKGKIELDENLGEGGEWILRKKDI